MGNVLGRCLGVALLAGWQAVALAGPVLVNPAAGTLSLVAADVQGLSRIDDLVFDAHGNLFGTREIVGSGAGVVTIDKVTGAVTTLVSGLTLSGADQMVFRGPGEIVITRELPVVNTPFGPVATGGINRVDVTYGPGNVPLSATSTLLLTGPQLLNNPEGIVSLPAGTGFGNAGDLVIAEDRSPGRIIRVAPDGSTSVLVDAGAALDRPEGLVYGTFGGAAPGALYAAETARNRIVRIAADGSVVPFGDAAAVGLNGPDNLEFGPDGLLYVAEDTLDGSPGRVLRLALDGTYTVLAEGFAEPAGLAFDPATGDLYIAEQGAASVWRLHLNPAAAVPLPGLSALLGAGAIAIGLLRRRRPR